MCQMVSSTANTSREWLDDLIARYSAQLYAYCSTLERSAAADLMQDTIVMVLRKWETFHRDSEFFPWLLTIAYHTWVTRYYRKRRPVSPLREDVDSAPNHTVEAPDAVIARNDACEKVRAALGTLPDHLRPVVVFVFWEDFSYAQIGKILGIPEGTVGSRLNQAKKLLRSKLVEIA